MQGCGLKNFLIHASFNQYEWHHCNWLQHEWINLCPKAKGPKTNPNTIIARQWQCINMVIFHCHMLEGNKKQLSPTIIPRMKLYRHRSIILNLCQRELVQFFSSSLQQYITLARLSHWCHNDITMPLKSNGPFDKNDFIDPQLYKLNNLSS